MNDAARLRMARTARASSKLKLVSGLRHVMETGPTPGNPPPPTALWTERYKAAAKPAE